MPSLEEKEYNLPWTTKESVKDISFIIARETSGKTFVQPTIEDFEFAQLLVDIINGDYRHNVDLATMQRDFAFARVRTLRSTS